MKAEYVSWIRDYVAASGDFVRGKCDEATEAMIVAFPELRRAAGFALASWGRDQHWWCVTPDGEIVDPTVAQFGAAGVFHYEELDLNDPKTRDRIPTGVCMDCGDEVYGGKTFCGDACERSARAALGF